MGLFSRSSNCSSKTPATTTASCLNVCNSLHSRNAFIHFVKAFRQESNNIKKPVWRLVMEAADKWNRMALHEKYRHIKAAHKTGYIFRSRNRRLNRIMLHMRKALETESKINLIHLTSAVRQMQLWKRKELGNIWRI